MDTVIALTTVFSETHPYETPILPCTMYHHHAMARPLEEMEKTKWRHNMRH